MGREREHGRLRRRRIAALAVELASVDCRACGHPWHEHSTDEMEPSCAACRSEAERSLSAPAAASCGRVLAEVARTALSLVERSQELTSTMLAAYSRDELFGASDRIPPAHWEWLIEVDELESQVASSATWEQSLRSARRRDAFIARIDELVDQHPPALENPSLLATLGVLRALMVEFQEL